ncbi:MAG: ribosome small subunit-dependent GTPase A [Candidatus Aegiribacteria sp.]|nr:ribosome small subunit-dependent GTPase A [Candidatus Aegiribacteria sp.]
MLIIDEQGNEISAITAGRVYHGMKPIPGDHAYAVRVGDQVLVEEILPRRGILQRPSPLGRSTQIIAANVDRVLVMVSLKNPRFSAGFVNRALVSAEWRKLPATIVLNKMDLCKVDTDRSLKKKILTVYGQDGADYPVFPVSCETGSGTDLLLQHIKGATVVMTGPSGSGKTSLAKYYNPSLDLKIGGLNLKTSKGKHTTVSAQLVLLEEKTTLIDTPGLRMFSIENIPKNELQFCFPEFLPFIGKCRFRDCIHMSEPGCAVKSASENGTVHMDRYNAYRKFIEEAESDRSGK